VATKQDQLFKTLSPQPTIVAGTPARLSATSIKVRSVLIESAFDNKKEVFIADTEANALTTNRHTLVNPTDTIVLSVVNFADLDGHLDLFDIWFDGNRNGDLLVVSYVEFKDKAFQ